MFKGKGEDQSIRPARYVVCFGDPNRYPDTHSDPIHVSVAVFAVEHGLQDFSVRISDGGGDIRGSH